MKVSIVLLSASLVGVDAVLPLLALDVSLPDQSTLKTYQASHALFGVHPPMNPSTNPAYQVVLPFDDNPLLCSSGSGNKFASNSLVLIPRGVCTFETKAWNAQMMGAQAVLIHGSLASRYALNTSGHATDYNYEISDIVWPVDRMDYDCTKGRALIPSNTMSFSPLPYNSSVDDPLLTGAANSDSLCWKNSPDSLTNCDSKMCLLTGKVLESDDKQPAMEACCAWDLHLWLFPDMIIENATKTTNQVTIPVAYLTTEQALQLTEDLREHSDAKVVLYARWRPTYNISAILIWLLGSTIAALAAYLTASDYHQVISKVTNKGRNGELSDNRANRSSETPTLQNNRPPPNVQEEVLELTPLHALGFVIMASSSLLVLFYFKIYGIVKVFYAIGCSTAVSQVILLPLTAAVLRHLSIRNTIIWRTQTEDIGDITMIDVIAHAIGYSFGAAWLFIALTVHDPETLTFFWITQDFFGACMCITFLKTIRLNSIRVASLLLIVAFFYDIFFVFVTPWLFGQSVMITVATSGGPPKADALWCEKYPDDKDCQGGNPMPMLLAIPRLFDFVGGSSLLGLGDIVLPGLLLSFAARFDAAKSLLGVLGGGRGANNSYNCPEQKYCGRCFICKGGYFPPIVVAYAIGLAMANTAVYVMNMGQPALLYLVPCCLGTLVYIGWRRNELIDLWEGPKALKAADDIVYGYSDEMVGSASTLSPSAAHVPLSTEEGPDSFSVPSAVQDNETERDGLWVENR